MNTPDSKLPTSRDSSIDLNEVTKLVRALERDLIQVQQGSQNLQTVRDEVTALQGLLNADLHDHDEVSNRLSQIRASLENVKDIIVDDAMKVAQYVAEIGRILGM